MMLNKMQIIFLLLLSLGFGTDIKVPEIRPSLHRKMMNLLQSCFADDLNNVIITPNLREIFHETSSKSGPISMIIMDENYEPDGVQRLFLHLPIVVLAPPTMESFEIVLQRLKSSPWWHTNALFFIIGNSRGGCKSANKILKTIWKMNLTESFFLCHEKGDGTMLYTYNPYTNRAPNPWKQVEEFNKSDDRWTLFVQQYIEGRNNCTSLKFDKTKFMDGYKVKGVLNAKPDVEWTENKSYNLDSMKSKHPGLASAIFFASVLIAMNVTTEINYDHPGYFHNGKAFGFAQKLIDESQDVSLSPRLQHPNMSSLYPLLQGSPKILTQQRNFLTPEEKILSFYTTQIKYLTGIVLFIAFVFILVIYKKREFALAAFDVLRLLLSSGLAVPFNRTATRIFFFAIFQLVIILHATFNGNLSSFLTKPERPYVDNMNDLQTYQYNVYAPNYHRNQIEESESKLKDINYIPGVDCTENVVKDSSTACIETPERMLDSASKHNLHISSDWDIPSRYGVLWCRKNWSLKAKMNYYISRFIEAGFYEYLYDHHMKIPLRKLKSWEEVETTARYRPITLKDLAFAFRLLGIGLGISSLVFMIEMFPWRKFLRGLKKLKKKCAKSWIIMKFRR